MITRITKYPYLAIDDLYLNKEEILNSSIGKNDLDKKIYIAESEKKMFCDYKISVEGNNMEFTVFQELEDVDFDKLEEIALQQVMEATKFQQEEEYERQVILLAEQMYNNKSKTIIQRNSNGLFKGIVLGSLLGLGLTYFVVKSDSTI